MVGDVPDVSSATNTGIISAEQVPNATVLATVNARLKKWAAAQPNVAIVPLANFIQKISSNEAITIHGVNFAAGKTRMLMQADHLHPTPQGSAVLALGILDALTAQQKEFSAKDIRWSPREVFQIGYKSAAQSVH